MRNLLIMIAVVATVSLFAFAGTETASAMNKAELIDAIAKDSGLSKADSKRALEGFAAATATGLSKGNNVQLVGFGSFSISKRAARALSKQDGLSPRDRGCLWLATRAPEWLHGLFCTMDDAEIIGLMTKSDDPTSRPLTPDQARSFLSSFSAVTTGQLVIRDIVEIDEFGAFSVQENKGRRLNTVEFVAAQPFVEQIGRNPQTGKEIKIAAKNVVKFKAGADLSKKVN